MTQQIDLFNAAQPVKGWTFKVTIDGVDFTSKFGDAIAPRHSAESSFATCALPVLSPFALAAGVHTVAYSCGWQGQLALAFLGEIAEKAESYFTPEDTFTCAGYLRRTQEALGPRDASFYMFPGPAVPYKGYYYSGGTAEQYIPDGYQHVAITSDADLIRDILTDYGLTTALTTVDIAASPFVPAQLQPVLWDKGTPGWAIISDIDNVADFRTADSRAGGIIRRQVFGTVPAGVRHTFVQGVDIYDLQIRRDYHVFNQSVVRGAQFFNTTNGEAEQVVGISPQTSPFVSPYIPNPPGVRTDEGLSSPLIESNDAAVVGAGSTADSVADRRLLRLAQPLKEFVLTVPACADYDVEDTIGVQADRYTGNAFVIDHSLNNQSQESSFTCRGSPLAEQRGDQFPIAQAVITVTQEWVIISGTLTKVAVITVDATASSDPDGSIASTSINIGGTVYPVNFVSHLTTAASPVGVTVTVTDNDGNSASVTRQATWDDATVLKEPITLAETTQAAASEDGEQTWRVQTAPDATAVGPIALAGTTLFGCSDGTLYRSTDLLLTAPALVHTFAAQVNCLWSNEQHTTRWLAGLSNGQAWLSIDDGLTWRLLHTFAAAINDVSESPFQPGEMTVCSGPSLWHTFNGVTWDALITVAGQTCTRFAAGFGKAYAAFANGTIRNTANGTIITVPGAPQITGLTLAVPFEELYVFVAGTAAYRWTPGGGLVAGPNTGSAVNRAIRSGTGGFVYLATANALQKWFSRGACWDVRLHNSEAVGYGSARLTAGPVVVAPSIELWLLPSGASGTADRLWHYVPGSGWAGVTPPRAGWYWQRLVANPNNPDEVLLFGNSTTSNEGTVASSTVYDATGVYPVLYSSASGGSSWTPVTLGGLGGSFVTSGNVSIWGPAWATDNTWAIAAAQSGAGGTNMRSARWRGSGSVATTTVNVASGSSPNTLGGIVGGIGGEIVAWIENPDIAGTHNRLLYLSAALAATVPSGSALSTTNVLDRLPNLSRVVVGITTAGAIWATADYRARQPTQRIGGSNGGSIAAAQSGIYVGNRTGILKVSDILGAAVSSVVAASGVAVGMLRVGQQQRSVIAAKLAASGDCYVSTDGGVTWSVQTGPGGAGPLADWVEVIERSGAR